MSFPALLAAVAGLVTCATAFNCTPAAFQAVLPATATVKFARQLKDNSTFSPSLIGDIAYPTPVTQLQPLCVVQVNVTSSPTSAFSFGLFLPDEWNERFLAVGNGGFAGGINWLDMGAGVGYGFGKTSDETNLLWKVD
jgi:feruloyl esterase